MTLDEARTILKELLHERLGEPKKHEELLYFQAIAILLLHVDAS